MLAALPDPDPEPALDDDEEAGLALYLRLRSEAMIRVAAMLSLGALPVFENHRGFRNVIALIAHGMDLRTAIPA